MTLFGERLFADVIKLKKTKIIPDYLGRPKSNGQWIYTRHTEENTERGEGHVKTRGREWSDTATSQGGQQHQKLEEARDGFSPRVSGGSMDTPDLGLLVSRIVRE